MWPIIFILSSLSIAEEIDLSEIKDLEEKIPSYQLNSFSDTKENQAKRTTNKFNPPGEVVHLNSIITSETKRGAITSGVPIVRITDNKVFNLNRSIFVRYFEREDELGFKYLKNNDDSCTYKIKSNFVSPIENDIALYEPPEKYTPAPLSRTKISYDNKLNLRPEASFYAGHAMGDYMKDLFNDPKARTGMTTQYGLHFFTDWKLPLKAGAVLNYEKTTYGLEGGSLQYSSLSFGPQFKTKNFDFSGDPYRFQIQLRVSPFARANAQTDTDSKQVKFNSTDILASLEHPLKNSWGEFVLSAFFQSQWLNIKQQSELVKIRGSNKMNTSIGFAIAQVFD
jgi:hypothetical protein